MKRNIVTILLVTLFSITLKGQVSTQNYINTRTVLNQQQTSYVDNIAYFDGIGRPLQNVEIATDNGTAKSTIATLQEYDNAGRQSRQWLPVAISGTFSDPATFKSIAAGLNGHNDTNPYTLPVYESSPLNRIAQQYGAGEAWHTNNKSVRTEYLTNTQSAPLNCKLYSVSNDNLTGGASYYTNGTLQVVKTLDEDSKVSYTFTDKLGRTILQRVINGSESLDTYFVYDALGNLRFVLQPKYQDEASLDKYAFQYKYNKFNLCCWKKIPGAEHVTYTYNENGLLTASQDGNQRNAEDSTTYTYDALYRIKTQNGIVNHYDNYDFIGETSLPDDSYPSDNAKYGKGKLTGKTIEVLGNGSTAKIYTVYHYDQRGRIVKVISNNLIGGYDITHTSYTYTGKPSTVKHTHSASGKTTRTEVTKYHYDEKDRVSKITHTLDNNAEVTLVAFTYDAYGRVTQKRLHGTNNVNYQYNIRNWVTGISATKFQQQLYYNTGNGAHCYNGNISSTTWESGDETTTRGYKFTYDGANRMTGGTYGEGTAISTNTNRFSETATYDKNGNILSLQRRGQTGSSSYGQLDNLSYIYNGNQITKIEDAVSTAAYSGNTAFTNGLSTSNEYAYDANGNITKDLNKGISNIRYNLLNLPEEVTFTNGNSTKFFYSAEGEKLRAVHTTGGTTTQVDYCGNIVYAAGVQKYLLNQEGYYDLEAGGYHYYLKDHLGNNRVVISHSGAVEQTTHYYPYGGTFASSTNGSNTQPYKYNGKELDTHNGLNWYDYGARHYDPAIARWTTQDPLAEKYYGWNQYNYCGANPVILRDKDGKAWDAVVDAGFLIYDIGSAIYSHITGDHDGAKQQWVSAGVDVVSMLIPGVTAPMAKGIVKGLDKAADAVNAANQVDNIVDAGKVVETAKDVTSSTIKAGSFTSSNFRKNLGKLTGGEMKGFDAHHIFPQEFETIFKRAGIDIHDPKYGVWWELHEHRQNAKAYNAEWKRFLEGNKTKEEILEKARTMAVKYGYKLNIE